MVEAAREGTHSAGPASPTRPRVVLHLRWDGRRLLAWAERSVSDPFRLLQASGAAPPHPAAVPVAELGAALGSRAHPIETWVRVELPSRPVIGLAADPARPRPVPAPGFGAPTSVAFPLAPFVVPGMELPPDFWGPQLFRPPALPAQWRLGGDARFWRQAARLATVRLARGSFGPGTGAAANGAPSAVWVPLPDPEVEEAEERLAAAMPPACRLPERPALALLRTFTAAAVDAGARWALADRRSAWSRLLRPGEPGMRWLLGLLHGVPLPLPAGVPRDFATAAGVGPAGLAVAPPAPPPRVRLVLRLEDPVAAGEDAGAADLAPPPGAALRCPLSLWIQCLDPSGGPAALLPLAEARSGRESSEHAGDPVARSAAAALAAVSTMAVREAARIWAPLAPAASGRLEDVLGLSPDEALELVEHAARRLEERGIEVAVPSWWTAPAVRPHASLHVSDVGGHLAKGALAQFEWEAALGDERMDAAAFERLVASRTSLVHLRDGWRRVDRALLARVAAAWAETGTRGRLEGLGALRLALEVGAEAPRPEGGTSGGPSGSPANDTVTVAAGGTVGNWLAGLQAGRRAGPLPEPPGFSGRLRPYQQAGLGWLAFLAELGLGGILADDMGLGKTVQVLALLAHRRSSGAAAGPTLLVCPTSVLSNWQAEAARFVPALRLHVQHGAARPRGAELERAAGAADLVATTYTLLARDREDLGRIAWDGVVLDEAQNVKNAAARQAEAARGLSARYRFALTGTPIENALQDLWSIVAFVLPGYLGGSRTFQRQYAKPVRAGDDAAAERLRRAVAPFVLRRTKRDPGVAPELPEKIETRQECPLTPEQAALYEALVRAALEEIADSAGLRRKAVVLRALLRLKQICDHPSLFLGDGGPLRGRSGKLRRLEELLADVVGEGDRALIFTQFATWARRLAVYLEERTDCRAHCLTGATPAAQRAAIVRAFQEERGPALFVLSLRAGGAGLNLTNAQHVFHFDRWWNPAVEEQATDRAYRIGQGRVVQIHTLVVRGTLEEKIDALIAGKRALADRIVGGASEAWITELSTDALRELFALSAEAVEA